ncbi:MAG: acetate--CoA ligase [Flavobacteriales bacterium]
MDYRIRSFEEYRQEYNKSVKNPEEFWNNVAQNFHWFKKWEKTLYWNFEAPHIKWFEGAETNLCYNCIDRHLDSRGDKTAIIWEPNSPGDEEIKLTYKELHQKVGEFANVLKQKGVRKGDRVCIYMPMVVELAVSVLACARIGAIHSVVFAGFSAQALADRIKDAEAKIILTSDGLKRGNKQISVKEIVDQAVDLGCNLVEKILVIKHTGEEVHMQLGRDFWYEEERKRVSSDCPAEPMDAEDILFILYTSGSTGKPKGVVHTTGGYMVYAGYSFANVFQYDEQDVFWCTADIGWVTGHSYLVYGPLLNGATTVMFEGVPTYPNAGRFWGIIDKYRVNQFYTAPTAIRSLMGAGTDVLKPYKLDSLKVIGSVGEPINEEAWHWYHDNIGKGKCPVVDTWWQTETGGIMISGLGSLSPQKPSHAGYPLPGIQPVLLDNEGTEITENEKEGYLAVRFPWPSILRTTYGDHERCRATYFSHYKGYYFTGDGAKRNSNGMYRIIGRVDDVINVSGHRFGTAEIESAINEHKNVIESAVVGYPHDIKGQGIYAFVICEKQPTKESMEALRDEIIETVSSGIGKIAKPDKIQFVTGLPKTRSGKIMRRILRKVAEGDTTSLGDTSTLLDPGVVNEIINGAY